MCLESSGKPDAWKLARPVWGWGRGATPRPTPRFDLFHAGHLATLEAARLLGDVLVVAVNSDASVRRLKGPGRPVIPEQERARILAGLECVNYVTIFEDDTPEQLIAAIRPGMLVKSKKERPSGVVGREFVESYGGRVVLAPVVHGLSTTGRLAGIVGKR
jgi:D-beta-D-heptose 7-phosphate kinase/D-beta-D-heptose 1-phosphate adenosyltransferase